MSLCNQMSLIAIFFSFVSFAAAAHEHTPVVEKPPTPSGDSLYQLKSAWQNQNGKEVKLDTLRDRPVVLAMAYTSCQASCPLIVEDMKKIEKNLIAKGIKDLALVLFSFDSKHDTPDRLKAYAQTRHLDLTRWTLFHGSPDAVRELAAVLGVRYREDAQGEFDHSNIISLLDANGVVRFQQSGLGGRPEEFEKRALALPKATRR